VVSILDLGKPDWFMSLYFFFHYRILIPILAFIFNGDIEPYKYFVDSEKRYPPPDVILKKLQDHGFVELHNENFTFGVIAQQLGIKDK